ncbi:hypothetical protein BX600DRAFT_444651 [Xylariales sp. PMI_506]|nr:hypothetical protein BX600DRAFT_444651 [Xylariales sp. PMI_506]
MDTWSKLAFHFQRQSISQLDKLSRRRSLSRTHIQAMFDYPRRPRSSQHRQDGARGKYDALPCSNCGSFSHADKSCRCCCGHCGSRGHKAAQCRKKASNRCKCRPFPQCHLAADCTVRCSRRCGSLVTVGHNRHPNAMLCTSRCCMCGVSGHAGKTCKFRACPCGRQHLTQDCRWKVECPARGCERYLCGLHCSKCGRRRRRDFPLVEGQCPTCRDGRMRS